ncbi:twin-arginine translocation pathway signal protein [Pseudomonas sp. HY7a-MNA-CIBAN-0227]|uniref:twin-arginine translocation pathway signal protein n=1 Tax=Pseudomonas sp. HY7a-MNA-CIBAN-0227 TaxID=3140474 RepID=UPI00332809B9
MNPSLIETPGLSRRGVLKIGLWASVFLATAGAGASLSGCSSSIPASGFAMLRSSDLPFLRAVIPVLLEGVASTQEVAAGIEDTLKKLDYSLQHLSPEMFKLTQQLFDVLGMAITRGPLTGVWGSWENASSEQIRNFLHRWENSYLNLLRMGQGSLLKLVIMAWYFRAQSWAHCGYPGPPNI